MYIPANIIYFTPFYFPDGSQPKNKYLIILKKETENVLIAVLPTTTDSIPRMIPKKHGCIDMSDINFNCYYFEKDKIITENGWGFPKETFIYGFRLSFFNLEHFRSQYKIEDIDYKIIGRLTNQEFEAIITCMKDSKSVKRKIRRSLGAEI